MTLSVLEIYALAKSTITSFLFLILVFYPMEKIFPAKENQGFLRPHWGLDLCYFLGQYLLWGAFVGYVLSYWEDALHFLIPASFRNAVAEQPWGLQVVEVIVLSDFLIYWGHRLQHKVGFLWRFHKVHHSSTQLDWLAAHREHPLDTIYTVGIINLPAVMLGFPLKTIAGLIAFRGIWAIYIHSNVRLPLKFLRVFIGAPELHHWHHDLDRDAGNYANISPLMDILFGTYVCPDHEPEHFGIKEDFPQVYWKQMLYPLLPEAMIQHFFKKEEDKPLT
ncbi:MAG: sterol desaturase family protein [Bacteroidia bacterium]